MTTVVVPPLLLAFVVPISTAYVGLGGALWVLGGRWERPTARAVARPLATSSGGVLLALLVGNGVWILLERTGGGQTAVQFGRWLTNVLVLLSLAALVVPPVVAVVAALRARRSGNRTAESQ